MIYLLLLVGLVATASGNDRENESEESCKAVRESIRKRLDENLRNFENFRQNEQATFEANLMKIPKIIVEFPKIKDAKAELEESNEDAKIACQEGYTNGIKELEERVKNYLKKSFDSLVRESNGFVEDMKDRSMQFHSGTTIEGEDVKTFCANKSSRPKNYPSLRDYGIYLNKYYAERIQSQRKKIEEMINIDKPVIEDVEYHADYDIGDIVTDVRRCTSDNRPVPDVVKRLQEICQSRPC